MSIEHPARDPWWDDRNLLPLMDRITIPVYLGCDWQNVPLHLPGALASINALPNSPHVQVAMMGEHGLSWPWESLHLEALAWYDHWLKGHDTGVLEGPHIFYRLPGADDGWHTSDTWPVPGAEHRELALRADGTLSEDEGQPGQRTFLALGAGLNRPSPSQTDPPDRLIWVTAPLSADLDVIGEIELRLDATASAADTDGSSSCKSSHRTATPKTSPQASSGPAFVRSTSRPASPATPSSTAAPPRRCPSTRRSPTESR